MIAINISAEMLISRHQHLTMSDRKGVRNYDDTATRLFNRPNCNKRPRTETEQQDIELAGTSSQSVWFGRKAVGNQLAVKNPVSSDQNMFPVCCG